MIMIMIRSYYLKIMSIIKEVKLVRITSSKKYPLLLEIEGEQYRFKIVPIEKEITKSYDLSHWKYLFSYVDVNDDLCSIKYLHLICQNIDPENPFLYIKHYRYDKDIQNFVYECFERFNFKVDNNSKFIEGKIMEKVINNYWFDITYFFKFQNGDKNETYKVTRGIGKEKVEKDIYDSIS